MPDLEDDDEGDTVVQINLLFIFNFITYYFKNLINIFIKAPYTMNSFTLKGNNNFYDKQVLKWRMTIVILRTLSSFINSYIYILPSSISVALNLCYKYKFGCDKTIINSITCMFIIDHKIK